MSNFNMIDWLAFILVVVGGLNWGTVGLFDFNIVTTLLGGIAILPKIVFIAVGVAAVWMLIKAFRRS